MADQIVVKCDACGKQFKAPADLAGKQARCPCGQVINVPEASGEDLARKWYYAKDGERYGPVPQSEIAQLVQANGLTSEDFVWCQGMPEWVAGSEVEELAEVYASGTSSQLEPVTSELQPVTPAPAQAPPAKAPAAASTTATQTGRAPAKAPPSTASTQTTRTTAAARTSTTRTAASKRPATQEVRAAAKGPSTTRVSRRAASKITQMGPAPAYVFVRIVSLVFMVLALLLIGLGVALAVLGGIETKLHFAMSGGASILVGVLVLCVSQLLAIARDVGIRTWQMREMAREAVQVLIEITESED